jgi:putative acetyltransferase
MKHTLVIRKEHVKDQEKVYSVNDLAFERSDEAELVDILRSQNKLLISLVAEVDKKIVGHIAFSRVFIPSSMQAPMGAGLAPMAVLKEYQNRRIGSALVTEGLKQCEEIGIDFVIVLGHPKYYPRFGFQKASRFGIRCPYDVPDEAFMILELRKGILNSISNSVIHYDAEFDKV